MYTYASNLFTKMFSYYHLHARRMQIFFVYTLAHLALSEICIKTTCVA